MGAASNDSTMKVSKEEMKRAGIDLAYRDFCAHLLIPLNECRRKSFFLPWKCGDERHAYEKCQYEECAITSSSTNASNFFFNLRRLVSSPFSFRSAFPFVPLLRARARALCTRISIGQHHWWWLSPNNNFHSKVHETRENDERATRRRIERKKERRRVP